MISRALLLICGGGALFAVAAANDLFSVPDAPEAAGKKTNGESFFDALTGKERA